MGRIIAAILGKFLSVKQRSSLALILLVGIIGGGIIFNWDEMISNIKNGRSVKGPHWINIEKCLKKPNFKQVGNKIIETLENDVKILELKQGIQNRKPLYYAKVNVLDVNVVIEVDMTEEMFKQLHIGEIWHLHREVTYNMKGWSEETVDKLTKVNN